MAYTNDKDLFRSLTDVKQNVNLNVFDLSRRHLFTAEPGFLKPVLCLECVPHDKIKINVGAFLRSQPLTTAAFMRCKGFFHFYFVPYSQLWHKWSDFLAQQDEPVSNYTRDFKHVPTFSLKDVVQDLSTHAINYPQVNDTEIKDVFGNNIAGRSAELLNMLGFGHPEVRPMDDQGNYTLVGPFVSNSTEGIPELNLNVFRPAAYQKIWSDYYRNPYYDRDVPVDLFNFDDFACQNAATAKWSNNRDDSALRLFTPRFRQWKKDLFMGTMPSTQDGLVSSVSFNNITLDLVDGSTPPVSGNNAWMRITNYKAGYDTQSGTKVANFKVENAFDVLQLRQAEALQKWKENTMRAGSRNRKQQLAHYGTVAKHEADTRCEFIGGFDFDISVDEVVATTNFVGLDGADFVGNQLGQVAGKVTSVTPRNEIRYEASEFGVLMCIFSALPESEYHSTGIDMENTLSNPFDFFTKEFENTGLVPLQRFALDVMYPPTGDGFGQNLGFVPRWAYLKTAVDKDFGAFDSDLSSWVTPRGEDLYPWAGIGQLAKGSYYVNPNVYDSIFAVKNDGTGTTDPFMLNCHFDIKALRNMTVLGLPQF